MITKHEEISRQIIKGFYHVYNHLGYGFLEKVYARAMLLEMQNLGLNVAAEKPLPVYYQGQKIGEYFADLVVERKIIVELKAVKSLQPEHVAQLLNYLKATPVEVGLLLNFGPKPQISRKTYDNHRKGSMNWLKP